MSRFRTNVINFPSYRPLSSSFFCSAWCQRKRIPTAPFDLTRSSEYVRRANKTKPRYPSTTDDALKLFLPGQKISLKPLDPNCSNVTFTVCKLSTPVTKSVVLLAKPAAGDHDQVVIKIFDPRYLDERIATIPSHTSHPWDLSNEQAAAAARPQNSTLTNSQLIEKLYSDEPEDLSGDELASYHLFWEERYYRLLMNSYEAEHEAYERLKDFQGSIIPRLIMTGQFLPLDERALQLPALVLEYIPSVNIQDVPSAAITPAICSQLLSAIEKFPSHGVVHNDITMTNIHFTPPEQPVRGFLIDFGCAMIRDEGEEDEEQWAAYGASDVRWARRLLEEEELRKSFDKGQATRFR